MPVILPELALLTHLEAGLTKLRNELTAHPTEPEKTWLFRTFAEGRVDGFRYFDEAAALLLNRTAGTPPLELSLGFPQRVSPPPSIHLLLPGESQGKTDTLGNSQQPWEEDEEDELAYNPSAGFSAGTDATFSRSFSATYNLMIVAQSSQQAVLLYHLLRALLVATMPQLVAAGLTTPALGGQDVQLDPENGPFPGLYLRTLSISLSYEARVPELNLGGPLGGVGPFAGTKG